MVKTSSEVSIVAKIDKIFETWKEYMTIKIDKWYV